MTGNYTKVPLRDTDPWTSAPIQAGRPLIDHELNLTTEALARAHRHGMADVIGASGVVEGTDAFKVLGASIAAGQLTLTLGPGRMWVDGLEAVAGSGGGPVTATMPVPAGPDPRLLVYLDAWVQHIQPAEQPVDLVDPCIGPIDSAARTRIAWALRPLPTAADTCTQADAELDALVAARQPGILSVERSVGTVTPHPCDPPGSTLARVPDGMLRVEVLDPGTAATARFAWSYENGAAAVPVTGVQSPKALVVGQIGDVAFAHGDLVELSWRDRRPDGVGHGELYVVDSHTAGIVTLTTPMSGSTPPFDADGGFVLRRWDGCTTGGAATAVSATYRGDDVGVTFTAGAGTFAVGDWWGSRIREAAPEPVELRTDALPDGVHHACAPLALVDLTTLAITDCRLEFKPLTKIHIPPSGNRSTCTVQVFPEDDIRARVDELVALADKLGGAELCFAAGEFDLREVRTIVGPERPSHLVVTGVGPGTVLQLGERGLTIANWDSLSVRDLQVHHVVEAEVTRDALYVFGCDTVDVRDCLIDIRMRGSSWSQYGDALGLLWTTRSKQRVACALRIAASPRGDRPEPEEHGPGEVAPDRPTTRDDAIERVSVERVSCAVGSWGAGIVIDQSRETAVTACAVASREEAGSAPLVVGVAIRAVAGGAAAAERDGRVAIEGARVSGAHRGIWVLTPPSLEPEHPPAGAVDLRRNQVGQPQAYKGESDGAVGIVVEHGRTVRVADCEVLFQEANPRKPAGTGIKLQGVFGTLVSVRTTSVVDAKTGLELHPPTSVPVPWVIDQLSCHRNVALVAATPVEDPNGVAVQRDVSSA